MKIKFLLLFALLTFVGCAKQNRQNPLFRKEVEKFFANKDLAPSNKFLANFQESITQWQDENGNIIKAYSRTQSRPDFFSYLPLLSFFSERNYDNFEIIITFSKNGDVLNIRNFYNKAAIESVAFCNSSISSCMKKIETTF